MDPLTLALLFGFGSTALGLLGSAATNATNSSIAQSNLESQEKWNQIQFDYNKELQQKLFDRADTAYIQQASQLSQLGINPVGAALSGTPSSAVVSQSVTAPQNNFQAVAPDFSGLNNISGMLSAFDGMQTNSVNRDVMRQTAKYNAALTQEKALQNLITANKNDINFDENGMPYLVRGFDNKEQDFNEARYTSEKVAADRAKRVDDFQVRNNLNDMVSNKIIDPAYIGDQIRTSAQEHANKRDKENPKIKHSGFAPLDSLKASANAVKNQFKGAGEEYKKAGKAVKTKSKDLWQKAKDKYNEGMNWIVNKIKNW